MNEVIEKRRSIRKYQADKLVTKEQLDALMEAAMFAPSAHNSRPWEFTAITKRELLNEFACIHPHGKMFGTAAAAIVITALPQGGKLEGFFAQDCAAAAQNILLQAVSMGLGSCWCGIYPYGELVAAFSGLLDIKEPKIPFCVIAIGTPDHSPQCRGFFDASKVSYVV